ncbi:Pleiotropic drug resistance protein 2 [Vitis vinifera]|uniref:Pleiotropic drug resistance protein 2 n=1 Tax=Vitis vinifera TaxID=29760 RepID=A0A438KGB4_VITVI|nr:Pleiotropic drug resistance protein 2 [Vitis vinifera]
MNVLGATYAATVFLGFTNASAVQSVVATERTVFYGERAAGMYSRLPYAFAQAFSIYDSYGSSLVLVAIETLYAAIQTLVYVLLYSMIGFHWQADKFLYFYYFIFMCFTYFLMYGMMVVALTPGHQIAAIVSSFVVSFWNSFSGFLIPWPLMPVWWRWYYWASPVAWTIYCVIASQVADKTSPLEIPGRDPMPVNEFLKANLGFDHDFRVPVVFAHLGWVLLFLFVFAYGIEFLNFVFANGKSIEVMDMWKI